MTTKNNVRTERTTNEIIQHLRDALAKGLFEIVAEEGHRVYQSVLDPSIKIPLTTPNEVARLYEHMVLNASANTSNSNAGFDALPRVSIYVGQPDTGKTYKAIKVAEQYNIDPLIKMCRDTLNLETLLEDFILVDGKPVFSESLALKLMADPNNTPAIIIFDEFNTLLTGVMKTLQPIFDDTSSTFEYRGHIYNKNLNCKFILTLNDKDKGISVLPDAILSRSQLSWFEPPSIAVLSKWTGVPATWIKGLQDVYKALGMLNIFGSRQIKMLNKANIQDIKNHLYGLCMMRNVSASALDTLELQQAINKLV